MEAIVVKVTPQALDDATVPHAPARRITTLDEWRDHEVRAWVNARLVRGLSLDFLRGDEAIHVRSMFADCGNRVGTVILRIVSLQRSSYTASGVTFNEYRPR